MAANLFASILCQNEWFILSKVDLNSLMLFNPLENENDGVYDTMKILMQVYLKRDASKMFWARRMMLNVWT